MLTELTIRDLAIIDRLNIRLHAGFNALTGETGAGKSIIIDAVDLLLGGRGDSTLVRAGAKRAIIEGVFRLTPSAQAELNPLLETHGLEGDTPDVLLLGREVRASGRSVARVNGRAVTVSLLRQIADGLVDIHGQSEHLSLLKVRAHLDLLDRYAGLWAMRTQVADKVKALRDVRQELDALIRDERALARRADLLQFQIEEIGEAQLRPDEEETLLQDRNRLANAEQLTSSINTAYQALREGDSRGRRAPALDLVNQALKALTSAARLDPSLAPQRDQVESLSYQLDDLCNELRNYQEILETSWDPRRLSQVEERLNLIRQLKRKYGDSIEAILAFASEAEAELTSITHSEERVEILQAQEATLRQEVGALAAELSLQRRTSAGQLAAAVEAELADLKMKGARFDVDFHWEEEQNGVPIPTAQASHLPVSAPQSRFRFDATGIDQVEFLVSANPGEELKPMVKVASGGETARLMLALKTVLSRADETPTLIFDEIDQGIGGRVGATVGQKLWALTQADQDAIGHQVLCVTHLPQLAGYGDRHFKVEKQVVTASASDTEGQRTVTTIRPLKEKERVEELAQMLGQVSESTRESAREILAQVTTTKTV
jgi:DNA repair protein RecN (Recombination protein N)